MNWPDLLRDLPAYWRFGRGLKHFLGSQQDVESMLSGLPSSHRDRSRAFLVMVNQCIFRWPGNPYLELLKMVGCTAQDLEVLVEKEGVEGGLQILASEGVYITVDEFKGKKPVKRGSTEIEVSEHSFQNPLSQGHLVASSGGSRSRGLRTVYEFRNLAARWTVPMVIRLSAYETIDSPIAVWYPGMPGAGPVVVLALARAGLYPKWFSPLKVGDPASKIRSRLGTHFIVHTGKRVEPRFPAPVFVPFEEPGLIVGWIVNQLRRSGRCTLMSYVSGAVRIAQKARTLGVDLSGAFLSVSSEPLTTAKNDEIISSGARAISNYSTMESGTIAGGCLNASEVDDMHILDDSIALIQHERSLEAHPVSVKPLLVTGLLDSFPKILFNTETGDQGELLERSCGCPLERFGFTRHICSVTGFDKLTGAGMTFLGRDLEYILEKILPTRFGGSSLDYQMSEEEDETGQTRLFLYVSPRLGALNEGEIQQTVLDALKSGTEADRFMAQIWNQSKTLQIRRQEPVPTARGKLLLLKRN